MPTSLDTLKEKGRRLRIHSLIATTEAGSGHPSSCLSAADLASVIFFNEMRFDPEDPHHPANDRFILSKGHAAPLLYAAYVEAGIIPEKEILTLRRLDSDLEGHPTPRIPWVDVATGSLGQGLSAGLGNALAAQMDGLAYNTYVLLGDGECAEGSVWEAAALASYYKASNLYVDGHNYVDIVEAFEKCRRDSNSLPRVIVAKTVKGKGVSMLENREGWHGKPLPRADLDKALNELSQPFASDVFRPNPRPRPAVLPGRAEGSIEITVNRKLGELVATREAYGDALVKLADKDTRIVALDGDTKNSTYSEKLMKERQDRFLEMFIAEQNMVGVAMGLSARGKIPFVSTFAAFLTRAHDQIRMAGVSRSNLKFCGSHSGVSIGEDGPSQMGLEDLAMFRPVPGSIILYPCDAVSTERLMAEAARWHGICYIRTTRSKTPVLYSNETLFPIGGSKVLRRSEKDSVTVVAAGITAHEALKAASQLEAENTPIRVIDAYSVKPIDGVGLLNAAKDTGGRIVVVEDHYVEGGLGDAVLNAVGNRARVVKLAIREIPRSGPSEALLDKYGINSKHIVDAVKKLM
ncbi:MAG: transketolase [Acidobacteria bacterium]|nr:MAG: transketolase [Acidobacteriota bacterium]